MGGVQMKRRNMIKYLFIKPLVLILLYGLSYIPSKIVSINQSHVFKIELLDGNDGKQTTIVDRENIEHIITNLNSITFLKGKPSFFSSGYGFRLKIYNSRENVIKDITINSENGVRYNGFFYTTTKRNIDYEYFCYVNCRRSTAQIDEEPCTARLF